MELVDAPHSKCGTFGFVGSSPTAPTYLMETYQRLPLKVIKGNGCWIWDDKGKKYLDAIAGIATCSLGHSDKKLRKALINQLKKIQHVSNLYQIPEQEALAEWLTKNSCADKVFFCNSGAEANEAAIKLARKHGRLKRGIEKPIILCAKSSFHGRTLAALSATGQIKYQKGFEPLLEGFEFFNFNDAKSFKNRFDCLEKNAPRIAAVLIEPVQGEGGIHIGNKDFFKLIKEICKENKILLIFDEVQTGMGRTGHWWGYEYLNVEPDAFTIAKGLGGGHAIGALLVKEMANVLEKGDHASTFGGNPFACKAGITVAEEIQKRDLIQKSKLKGEKIEKSLNEIINLFPDHFSETRGIGLMRGLVIKDNSKLTAQLVIEEALKERLLVISAGEKVIRMVPPLTINDKEISFLIKKLKRTLQRIT